MKILVLGNGFDLDHDLPTGYSQFLNFCNYVLTMDDPELKNYEKLTVMQLQYVEILEENIEIRKTFCAFIKENSFLHYFNVKRASRRENWIDFEQEIKYIIDEFKNIEYELQKSDKTSCVLDKDHKLHQILKALNIDDNQDYSWDENRLEAIHKLLSRSFNSLALALEYYISIFINNTSTLGVSPDIVDFDAKYVLTFNYSNTYEKIYGGVKWDEKINHIHGNAIGDCDKEPNIILGITSTEEELPNYYVEFEKYFQRITKKTGSEHRKWLEGRLSAKEKIEIMFFGHSLDAADKDVITDLIYNDKTVISIYYYDENAFQLIVANLIKILGKKKLIEYVSGQEPKIQFVSQRNHLKENTAGLQITRDTRKLYNFFTMSKTEINQFLLELKSKIEKKELQYFYSQKKTISLFEALKYHRLDLANIDSFFEICELLDFEKDSKGNVVWINPEEWNNYTSWGNVEPCDDITLKLISKVNELNAKRFLKEGSTKLYAPILTLKTSGEIKEELIKLFEVDTPNKSYWKQLDELSELMYGNSAFSDALNLLCKENLPINIRAKAKHFDAIHDENCYNIGYMKQMVEEYQDEIEA